MNQLAGKVAIVTGGASGIGAALAEELALRGCEVVIADRQLDLARTIEERIHNRGGKAISVELDVRDFRAFERLAKDTVARARRIDFLFNNAGIAIGGEVEFLDPEDFDDTFDVNLRGVAYGIQAVYPVMLKQRSGHIVNTASVAGLVAAPANSAYCATKHAVVGLTKTLRMEAKRHGVRASVLCPGAIRTPILTGGRFGRVKAQNVSEATILKQWERTKPMAPSVFAKKGLDALMKNEPIIVFPRWWKAFWYIDRISPSLSMFVWETLHKRIRRELEADGMTFVKRERTTNGHGEVRAS